MKRAILAGIVLLALLLIISLIRTGRAAPRSDGVSFDGFRTNAAGRLDAFYSLPGPNERRKIGFFWVKHLRPGRGTNSADFQMEPMDGEATRMLVPLSVGEEPLRPGDVCQVVSWIFYKSWEWRLRRMFHLVWPTDVTARSYDRDGWSTNELIIPQTIPPGRADKK